MISDKKIFNPDNGWITIEDHGRKKTYHQIKADGTNETWVNQKEEEDQNGQKV